MVGQYNRANAEERRAAFLNDMTSHKSIPLRLLPDLTPQINHDGGNTRIRPLDIGFYVGEEIFSMLKDQHSVSMDFTIDDALSITREDSRHQVFFGNHIFSIGRQRLEESVAVKAQKAQLKELAMYQLMGKLGIGTFTPYGFIVSPNGNRHLLTKMRPSVMTIDSVDWQILDTDEKWYTARAAVDTMVVLHKHMLFDGDLEFRNVGVDDFGDVVKPDPEFMISMRNVGDEINCVAKLRHIDESTAKSREIHLAAISRKMGKDFTTVCASVDRYIFDNLPTHQQPKNNVAKFKQLERHIYRPYRNKIEISESPYRDVLLCAFDNLLRQRTKQAREGII